MRIETNTNLSKKEIRAFVAMARPPTTKIGTVIVRNAGKHSSGKGRAYMARQRIKVWLPRKSSKHCRAIWPARKAYLGMAIGSREELLLMLLAHELRHLWQHQGTGKHGGRRSIFSTEKPRPRKGMVHGSRGRYSEKDADAWALHRLRQYRRGELDSLKRSPK